MIRVLKFGGTSVGSSEALKRLRGIVKYGVGIDAIDIVTARARRIPVVNVPEYAEETVAEGALALMLALARKLKPLQREMQERGWAWPTSRWLVGMAPKRR